MKAIRVHQFGGPEVLRLEEVPKPQPSPGQILVRIHAVGVNPVETYIRFGSYAARPNLPYTPGADGAGVVEAVGDGVKSFKTRDRVYMGGSITGTYAEYALCEPAQVHPLPENISFQQGAGVNTPYATAYRALFQRAKGMAGETVLVHGATGGVGIASVQLARAAGLAVIGTGGTEKGRRLVSEQGAHHVLDHRAPDYLKQILELTSGQGVDVILEMASHINLGKDLTVLAKNGRVAVIGSRGPVEINPRDAMSRDAAILGVMLGNASAKELAGIHAALVEGLRNGTLRPIVGTELPLAEAAAAHKAVMDAGAHGKIVLLT
ncbi:MAG TPA: NADPH:quinone reductase [Verrucomicrobiae bacterium]|nr:NADPH:quinone reductase [Verrucomicrobiae bacterium]